jgi:hypothetical protein
MKNTIHFLFLLCGLLMVGCNKSENINPSGGGEQSLVGCEFQYGAHGYIVQENGILNFQDGDALNAFRDTLSNWSDDEIAAWEASTGANTAYGNYIEAENALAALVAPYEFDAATTEQTFQPIFNAFVQSHSHLASITTEDVEPHFHFPYYYFVNQEGIFRVCDQEYSIQGSLLFSYPVGQQDLVATWNGQIGEFEGLSVQPIVKASTSEILEQRKEDADHSCLAYNEDEKKRILIKWRSKAYKKFSLGSNHEYYWDHECDVKAQRRVAGVWIKDSRHISLAVTGWIRNRHENPLINVDVTHQINFFTCKKTDKIKADIVKNKWASWVNDNVLNNFAYDLTITGANRTSNCQTVQYSCTMQEVNE